MRVERIDLQPCDLKKGFYIVPNEPRFSVNREGVVFDRQNNEIAENSVSYDKDRKKNTYLSVYDCPVHRLVAETFLDKSHIPSDDFPIVNHINGIITDNRVDNLEWTTYSGNSQHAYKTGLRSDNVRVLTKNIDTGDIFVYYSIQECARRHGINAGNITLHLKSSNREKVFNFAEGKFLLIKEGEHWPEKVSEKVLYGPYGSSRELLAFSEKQRKAYVFNSISQCMRFTGVSEALYHKRKRSCDSTVQIGDWEFTPMHLVKNLSEHFEDKRKDGKSKRDWSFLKRKPVPVKVTHLETNNTKEYDSLETFCKMLGVKKNTVQKHILVNKGIWRGEFKIDYLSTKGPIVK